VGACECRGRENDRKSDHRDKRESRRMEFACRFFKPAPQIFGIERVRKVRQLESQILRLVRCWLYEVRCTKSGNCLKEKLQERGKSTAKKKLQREKGRETRITEIKKEKTGQSFVRKKFELCWNAQLLRYRFFQRREISKQPIRTY